MLADSKKPKKASVLENIYKSSLKFLYPLNVQETYKIIVEEAMKLVNGQSGSIFIAENDELIRVYASEPWLYSIKIRTKGNMYNVYKTRRPRLVNYTEIKKVHPEIKSENISSDLTISLSNKSQSIGVLSIQSSKYNQFTSNDVEVLQLFSSLASLAIRKDQLYDEIREALETRDLFISMASHELRTPLTTINGYINLLANKLAGSQNVEARWVKELSWESYRLTQLVKELLEINRIKSGQLDYHLKECHFNEIIERALHNFQFTFPDYRVSYQNTVGQNDRIIGDFDKILQVVNNVLENSAKYSPNNPNIEVKLKKDANCLVLNIKDHGIGIQNHESQKVFENFYRGSNQQKEGLGLGLYLAKYILERHNGSIKIKSKPDKGTSVDIKLPMLKYGKSN